MMDDIYNDCIVCNNWGTSGFCKDQDTFVEHIQNHPWLVGNHNVDDCTDCQMVLGILKIAVEKIIGNDNRVKQGLPPREYLFIIPFHNEIIHFCIPAKGGYFY